MRETIPLDTGTPAREKHGTQPLKRPNLFHELVDRIRTQILNGEYEPGGPLPSEGKLVESLGVSHTVVRESMKILGAQGLVEISQGKRPRIRPADPQTVVETFGTHLQRGDHSLLDLIEVWRPLEAAIAALASQRATPVQITAMEKAYQQMADAKHLEEQVEYDLRFHDLLAESTRNPLFSLLLTTLAQAMRRLRSQTISRTGADRANRGHRAILEAILRCSNPDRPRARGRQIINIGNTLAVRSDKPCSCQPKELPTIQEMGSVHGNRLAARNHPHRKRREPDGALRHLRRLSDDARDGHSFRQPGRHSDR